MEQLYFFRAIDAYQRFTLGHKMKCIRNEFQFFYSSSLDFLNKHSSF